MKNPETLEQELERIFRTYPVTTMDNGCWKYNGRINDRGYGTITTRDPSGYNRTHKAHRVAYMIHHGFMPDKDIAVCHSCDYPACVNPRHLFLGSKKDNWDDMRRKKRHALGERHHWSKLKEPQVAEIKWKLSQGQSIASVAREYKMSDHGIAAIKHGKNWVHVEPKAPQESA